MNDTAKITHLIFFFCKIGNTVILWAVTICVKENRRVEQRAQRETRDL